MHVQVPVHYGQGPERPSSARAKYPAGEENSTAPSVCARKRLISSTAARGGPPPWSPTPKKSIRGWSSDSAIFNNADTLSLMSSVSVWSPCRLVS